MTETEQKVGEVVDTGSISDGYHTFSELYEHRITLWIALCRAHGDELEVLIPILSKQSYISKTWRSEFHSDGSRFEGWFILGMYSAPGKQITYHLPLSYWDQTSFAETLLHAPEFDGHTSADVLKRIAAL